MRRTLTLPDGRTLSTSSTKRWHVIVERSGGELVRLSSSSVRSRALGAWRAITARPAWMIDVLTGDVERTPDSPRR